MRILVTGAGGFLGQGIVRALHARGDEVVTLQRGNYPELEAVTAAINRGDIGDAETVMKAATGCDAVMHVAAKAGVWELRRLLSK